MEYSCLKEQPNLSVSFCEIGLMTSNNYKVLQLASPKPKPKAAGRVSKIEMQPQLQISQIATYGRNICMIDENRHLWLVTYQEDYDNKPQNLSLVLGKKVNEVFVSEEEIIAKCQNRDYLIYLKENLLRKLPSYVLQKIPYKNIESNSERYTIYQLEQQHGNYFLSHSENHQKVSLSMAYDKNKIKNIETKEEFFCEGDIVGVHFSKYHTVCWDSKGILYSWGLRSSWIVETTDLIMTPKKVKSLEEQFIFNGVADEYYCIVLNREGELIEWGIKNKIQIYRSQRIKIRTGFERMIGIKGIDKMYASMGITGRLYFWGEGAQYFINGIPGNRETPTICKRLAHKKLSDFDLSKQYVIVVSSPVSELVRRFKMLQINGIKTNFKKLLKSKTQQMLIGEGAQISALNFKQRFKTSVDKIDTVFECDYNEDDIEDKERQQHLFNYIDSKPRTKRKQFSSSSINFSRVMQHNKMSVIALIEKGDVLFDRINSKISGIKTSVKSTTSEIKYLMDSSPKKIKHVKKSRFCTSRVSKQNMTPQLQLTMRKTTSYDFRLKQVTERKSQMDVMRLTTLTQNTLEKRKLKKEAMMSKKKQGLLHMIMSVMMKDWLCRVLTKPIVGAKLMIVEQYKNSIAFEMKVKRFQTTFFKKYINKRIESLSPYNKFVLNKFLQRTKAKLKKKRQQKLVKNLLIHSATCSLRQKISHMIMLYTYTIKKYQKIVRWLKQVKTKKLLAMRIKWNINLINSNVIQFKDANMLSQFRNSQFDQLEVYDIYQNFVKETPHLKLSHFMDLHPIFMINFNITKKINIRDIAVPKSKRPGTSKKYNAIIKMMKKSKISKMMLGKKTESRDNQFQKLKIYPYSQDYDQIIMSRKFNLKISENVLKFQRWSEFEATLLEKLLQHQMHLNEVNYLKQLEKYEIQMACFIEVNYDNIQIRRSRYLLIPPIISTSTSNKMKRELDKMLSRAGKQYLLKEHMLEDRHIILDIALGLVNCPKKPILADNLGKSLFKELLMLYMSKVAKASRLFNVKNVGKLDQIFKF